LVYGVAVHNCKGQEDQELGVRLAMAGYKDVFILDKDLWVIEHEPAVVKSPDPFKCLPPSAKIITNGYTLRRISDVKRDDLVLTSTGDFGRVKRTFKRPFDGYLVKLIPFYTNIPIIVSPEHPILCARGWVEAKNVTSDDYIAYPRIRKRKDKMTLRISSFVNPTKGLKLVNGKWYEHPNQYGNRKFDDEVEIDSDFVKLAAYYVGEGNATITSYRVLCFSFGDDEVEMGEDVIDLMDKVFGIKPYSFKREKTAWVVRYNSSLLTRFFGKAFGYRSHEKHLLPELLEMQDDLTKTLLGVFYLCEGLTKEVSYDLHGAYFMMNTSSELLAYQLRMLFHKIGIPVKLWMREPNPEHSSAVEGGRKIVPKKVMWYITVPPQYNNLMEKITRLKAPPKKRSWIPKKPFAVVSDDYIYVRVRMVTKERFRGELFNIETEGNTYTTQGVIVHNCNYSLIQYERAKSLYRANDWVLTRENYEWIRESICRTA